MEIADKTLIVIIGPTASGKTALSIKVAREFGTEILSADSRQIYKEMNIGTAKPSAEELSAVKHYFINSHPITEDYNIGKYESDALAVLGEIFKTKNIAVLTGGSGLYVKALCEGMDEVPEADTEVREQLTEKLQREGLASLLDELSASDPVYYAGVDRSNTQRILRALEVCRSAGMPFSSFRKGIKKERPFRTIKIGMKWERSELYGRIDRRMDEMIAAGLFEEAKQLYPFRENNALQTVGYKEIFDWMEGKYDREEAVRLLKRNSRRYAKRQMTWFSRDPEIFWMDAKKEKEIIDFIKEKVRSKGV